MESLRIELKNNLKKNIENSKSAIDFVVGFVLENVKIDKSLR